MDVSIDAIHAAAKLTARPHSPTAAAAETGLRTIEGVSVYVPATYRADVPASLLVMLHGANGTPKFSLTLLTAQADKRGFILVAPKSVAKSWDVIHGGYGPDVAALDRVLAAVFDSYAIDANKVAISGFSDGASYALSLGLTNGTLFGAVLAFSPGFHAARTREGKPRVLITHGTKDPVLPIERTSRRIVPRLERSGYAVKLIEFTGDHEVPRKVAARALAWWLR